jgi:hypothetical protein
MIARLAASFNRPMVNPVRTEAIGGKFFGQE